jgi:hypothetical protein
MLLTGSFSISLSFLKVGMLACLVMDVAPLCQIALGGVSSGWLSPVFPWYDGPSGAGRISEVLPGGWFVSSHWSLLPIGQVAIELYDCSLFSSLTDFLPWPEMFLFSPSGSCVVL